MNKISDFENGDEVTYCPSHAKGDLNHKDCENGYVSDKNDKIIFVRYWHPIFKKFAEIGKGTDPEFLHKLKDEDR